MMTNHHDRDRSDASGFDVQPAALIGAAGTYDAEADALEQAASALRSRLAQLGACWGTDDVGVRFGTTYEPAAETVLNNLGALSMGLLRISAALRAVANSYEVIDGVVPPTPVPGAPPIAACEQPAAGPPPSPAQPPAPSPDPGDGGLQSPGFRDGAVRPPLGPEPAIQLR